MKKILMASLAMTLFAASAITFQLTSCKKAVAQIPDCPECAECPAPIYPVEGIYIVTYSVDSKPQNGDLYYSFVVFPDGSILTKGITEFGDTTYQKGAWQLSGDSIFTANIATFSEPSTLQTITGKFFSDGKISNSKWKDTFNPNGEGLTGEFSEMKRIN
jgi:hypothetical protein